MATNVLPTPGTGDNVPTPAPEPIVVPATPTDDPTAPAQLARQELYAKYYGQQTPEPTPAEPVVEPTPAAPVQAPAPAEPQPDLAAVLKELNELKAAINKPATQPVSAPAAPVAIPPTTPEELAWVQKLNSGDLRGFEEEIAKSIRDRIAPAIQQQAVERALTLRRVEDDISQFTDTVRKDNPDLDTPEMTHFITSAVERRVAEAMDSERIQDPFRYAEVFKTVMAEEVKRARTFIESLRGTATPQPQPPNPNIRREIISGAGVTPTATPAPGAPSKPGLPPAPTVQDYMAARLAASNRGKMLG